MRARPSLLTAWKISLRVCALGRDGLGKEAHKINIDIEVLTSNVENGDIFVKGKSNIKFPQKYKQQSRQSSD